MLSAFLKMVALLAIVYAYASSHIIDVPSDQPTIQAGINASTSGDTVLVQPGTYIERIEFSGRNISLGSLFLITGDTNYITTTIIDGDSLGSVVTIDDGEDSTALITGFTVRNGFADYGAGIKCNDSSPTIFRNVIRDNIYTHQGGGVYIDGRSPHLSNCIITNNSSVGPWGTGSMGSGIACVNSNAIISKNLITANRCGIENENDGFGAGVFCAASSALITQNVISGNFATMSGGGLDCIGQGTAIFNNIITGNWTMHGGGGIAGSATIINNVIVNNSAGLYGGGFHSGDEVSNIANNVFWGNSAPTAPQLSIFMGSVVTFNDIEDGYPGNGNFNSDPLFRNSPAGDFRLQSISCGYSVNSPCIDAGHHGLLDSLLNCDWGLGTDLCDVGAFGGGDSLNLPGQLILVPDDYPTIQGAIDNSLNGDIVIARPRLYYENINFYGRRIIVGSLFVLTGNPEYISTTIIDGGSIGSVVTFINNEDSNSVITGFTIQNGRYGAGGGIFCDHASPVISDNIIRNNTAYHEFGGVGGGIGCYNSSPSIMNNYITGNYANDVGGGVALNDATCKIINNFIIGNTADFSGGGGIFTTYSDPIILDNTIVGNNAASAGGGILHRYSGSPAVINTIIWENNANTLPQISTDDSVNFTVNFCDIQGGWQGIGNLDIDPQFRNPEDRDYHLMSIECGNLLNSPCIDFGDPLILDSLLSCQWGLGLERSDIGACGGVDFSLLGLCNYIPGDANNSGHFDGLDVVYSVNYFKSGGNPPPIFCDCHQYGLLYASGDANGNCSYNGLDVTYSVNYLKGIGPAPTFCTDCPPSIRR